MEVVPYKNMLVTCLLSSDTCRVKCEAFEFDVIAFLMYISGGLMVKEYIFDLRDVVIERFRPLPSDDEYLAIAFSPTS